MSASLQEQSLNKLGKCLIESLKDDPLESIDRLLTGRYYGNELTKLERKLAIQTEEVRSLIKECVIIATMEGMINFLDKITEYYENNNDVELIVDGQNAVEIAFMELAWSPFGEDGWEALFSRYPTVEQIYQKYRAVNPRTL